MRAVFLTFLRLGMTSFGGPVAHLGYFRREFVERQRWIDEHGFTRIVALCSILPGPTSSQVGMMIGLQRAGPAGAVGAWLGFMLPSALALTAAALLLGTLENHGAASTPHWLRGLLSGLTAAATGIVAQAVLAMAKTQCADRATQTIAAGAALLALAVAGTATLQWLPIAAGACAGSVFLTRSAAPESAAPASAAPAAALPRGVSRAAAAVSGTLFLAIAFATLVVGNLPPAALFLVTIVRAGSLVFGGGHVVLPLLASLVPSGLIAAPTFYAGYGLAQAVPGPLFTFAAFLGYAERSPLHGFAGALCATVLIFLPSFLLVFAVSPVLGALRLNPITAAGLRGANAAVVGLLGALLYTPLITGLGSSSGRFALAVLTFTLVTAWRIPPWIAVTAAAALGGVAGGNGYLL